MKKGRKTFKRTTALLLAALLTVNSVDVSVFTTYAAEITTHQEGKEQEEAKEIVEETEKPEASIYAETPDFSSAKVLTVSEGVLCIDGDALTDGTIPTGNYKLTGNITTDKYIYTEGNINLDLNGYVWDMSDKHLFIAGNVTFSLYDNSIAQTGKLTSSGQCTIYESDYGSTFNLYSGTVEKTSPNAYAVDASFGNCNLYGGKIISNAFAVFYYLSSNITINIDNTSLECGKGYAQIKTFLDSQATPSAVIDVSDYTGETLAVDAYFSDAVGKTKIFTGISSKQEAENYKVNVSCDKEKDYFLEKEEYEETGGNKYVYVSESAFTQQPTEENNYMVTFNNPNAKLQWCETTTESKTGSSASGEEVVGSYSVNAGDMFIVSIVAEENGCFLKLSVESEESKSYSLDYNKKRVCIPYASACSVTVKILASFEVAGYKIEHVKVTKLDGETANKLSNPKCETTYRCIATVGEKVYCSDEVTMKHNYVYTASGNVISKECTNCGNNEGKLTITAEGGIYNGTTAYSAIVEKTGIFENEEVNIVYYNGDTELDAAPVDAGTYRAGITYGEGEGKATASVTYTIAKATPYIAAAPSAEPITYGQTLGSSSLTNGKVQYSENGSTLVAGNFVWQKGNIRPTAKDDSNNTRYTVIFKPTDSDNYNEVETEITITVNKAQYAPNMPGSTMSVQNSITKVGDVTLPEYWVWQESDKDTPLEVEVAQSATALYEGADKGNYENESVNITITRSACDHVPGEILYTGTGEHAPDCVNDGLGHKECTKCQTVTESGIEVAALGHTGGTATCTKKAVCTRCKQEYGTINPSKHAATEVRNVKEATCTEEGYTGDTYCKICEKCLEEGENVEALGHTGGTATCTKKAVCTRCEQEYGSTDADNHVTTEVRNAKEAGCTTKGYTGDTYCTECNTKLKNGKTVKALGHDYVSSVTQKPTLTSEGVRTHTCSRCKDTYTETLAKLTVTYTVSFRGNGSTSGTMSNQKMTYGKKTALRANKFKKTGYTFVGWNTKADGSGKSYTNKADGSKLTKTDGKTVTLYAQWAPKKYTVVFNGNGSTSGKTKQLSNCKYGKKYILNKNGFKKTGYTFAGWNTKADGSGKTYKDKAGIKNLSSKSSGKVTLYAQWKETKYEITYKLNKGTNNKKNPSSYTVETKTITLKKPTRKGYTFKGWYSDKKCTKKVTKIKKGSTGKITLYAKWENTGDMPE